MNFWMSSLNKKLHGFLILEHGITKLNWKKCLYQNLQPDPRGTEWTGQLSERNFRKRLHSTITISNGVTLLLRRQKRWKTQILSGLSVPQWTHHQECLSPTLDYRIVGQLKGARRFTKLDIRWGYNNVRFRDGDQWKAAFKTNKGLYVLEILYVGLMNKATWIARHKAGIGVEQGMCYVLDQTNERYHPHRVSIYTERKCGCI